MTTTWELKCWNSTHIHNNSVLHYLYNMAVWPCYLFQGQSIQGQGQGLTSLVGVGHTSSSVAAGPNKTAFTRRPTTSSEAQWCLKDIYVELP